MHPSGMQIYGELCAWTLARSERDHQALAKAAATGRIIAQRGL